MTPTKPVTMAVTLVCVAHFFSHFNMMLLPPLLPVISQTLGIGYTEIGIALTTYSLMSALTQTPMGFAVDKYGAARILIAGVALEAIAFALIGVLPALMTLILFLGIAGIANAVYHPADYSILNQVVPANKIGKAFSYHTASGLLGEAMAPACILVLSGLLGWRAALVICGGIGLVVAATLARNSQLFGSALTDTATKADKTTGPQASLWRGLLTLPLIMGLIFFIGISLTTRGVNGFSVSALHVGQGMSIATAGILLSAWLFAAPLGVLVGGRLADRQTDHAKTIICAFLVVAATLATLAWFQPAFNISLLLFAIGGFSAGIVAPSRDMLIRSITPPGQTGKAFGFVSTGFNLGGMMAPPLYGYLLDNGMANGVFWTAALASLLTIGTVISTRTLAARAPKPTADATS